VRSLTRWVGGTKLLSFGSEQLTHTCCQIHILVPRHLVHYLSIGSVTVRPKILSPCCKLVIVFSRLLPETLRVIVGDGSIIRSNIYRPIIPVIGRKIKSDTDLASFACPQAKPPRNPLRLLMNADIPSGKLHLSYSVLYVLCKAGKTL
jgi:hypothetical protein